MNWPTGPCVGVRSGGMKPGFWQEVEGSEKICPMMTDVVMILDSWDPGGGGPSDTLAVAFAGTSCSLNFCRTLL